MTTLDSSHSWRDHGSPILVVLAAYLALAASPDSVVAGPPCIDYASTTHWQEQWYPGLFGSFGPVAGDGDMLVIGEIKFFVAGLTVLDSGTGQAEWVALPGDRVDHVAIDGGLAFAYVASAGALHVIDVTTGVPNAVGTLSLSPGLDIAASGSNVFVASNMAGVRVVDVSAPTNPTLVATIPTPDAAFSVAVDGDLLFVGTRNDGGLTIYDVTNVATPVLLGSVVQPGAVFDLAVSGARAYLCGDGDFGLLTIVDVDDPVTPDILASVPGGLGTELALDGDHVWTATTSGTHRIDVSNPLAPVVELIVPSNTTSVAVAGSRAYISTGFSLECYAIGAPLSPIGMVATAGGVTSMVASHQWAAFDDGAASLGILDLTNPANPTIVAHVDVGTVNDLARSGHHVFVATHGNGVQIVDVSDPQIPVVVGSLATPAFPRHIVVDGDLAIIEAGFTSGVGILDVSDPTAPILTATLATNRITFDVAIEGTTACYSEDLGQTVVLDLTNPATPVPVANVWSAGNPLLLENSILYQGFSDPFNDKPDFSLQIVDLSTPSAPVELAEVENLPFATEFAVDGNLLYITTAGSGTLIYDLSSVTSPELVGGGITNTPTADVAVNGDLLLLSTTGSQINVLPKQCATTVGIGPVGAPPNTGDLSVTSPMHRSGVLRLALEAAVPVRLAVYDARGRLVRTLVDAPLLAGAHVITWDGRGNDAQRVARGVYFAKLTVPGRSAATRIVVVD